jgi:hypothetical protein
MRKRNDLGSREHARIGFCRPGFVSLEPGGPWIECQIQDVSEGGGACLDVGAVVTPTVFMLLFASG